MNHLHFASVAEATGQASRFAQVYDEYKKAPDVIRERIFLETMERVLQNVPKTIVEAPGVTPYLPLPEVQKRQPQPQQQQQRGDGQ